MNAPIPPRRPPRSLAGFTLVELLVVIGIITILASLLLPVLSRVSEEARAAECTSNLSQIYKAARQYAPYYKDYLPDLYRALPAADHPERYRKSHLCRTTTTDGQVLSTGLWLLKALHYAEDPDVYYCPNIPGRRRLGGSQNPTQDGARDEGPIPESVGYAYNYFPPGGLDPNTDPAGNDTSNCFSFARSPSFYALLADRFEDSLQMSHASRNGVNVCYWDGSVQFIKLDTVKVPWKATQDEAEVFSDDLAGSLAVRDMWSLLSKQRR